MHGSIDLTIPGGGWSPSAVVVPCGADVSCAERRDLGSRNRILFILSVSVQWKIGERERRTCDRGCNGI